MKARGLLLVVAALVLLVAAVLVFLAARRTQPTPVGLAPLGSQAAPTSPGAPPVQAPDSSGGSNKPRLLDASEDAMDASLIIKAQTKLQTGGFYDGPIDGRWTRQLNGAVKAYQRSHGLRITGILDGNTRASLGI